MQAQLEDGARLFVAKPDGGAGREFVPRVGNQVDQRADILGRPVARHHLLARLGGTGCSADQPDHLVDIGNGDGQTHQHVRAITRLAEQVLATAGNHLLTESREGRDHILEIELLRPPTIDGQHVGAERGLQIREAPQLVQHHLGYGITLELDDDPHTLAARLVPNVGNAFDPLFAHLLGDLLNEHALVHLVGNGRDDQRLAILADLLDVDFGAHDDRATTLMVGRHDSDAPEDQPAGWKIGTRNELAQFLQRDLGIVEMGDAGIDHFAQIVRRNVGRHANGNAARTIDQQIWKFGGQHGWLPQRAVIILAEVDGLLVEVVE